MPQVLWVHAAADPFHSGELRRLGVPALASEGGELTSDLRWAGSLTTVPRADVLVLACDALEWLPRFAAAGVPVIVELDADFVDAPSAQLEALRGLRNRIAGVVARDTDAADLARTALDGRAPVWVVPDCSAREVELMAAARRFAVRSIPERLLELPPRFELWFSEPGDRVEPGEIEALATQWRPGSTEAVIIAPPETHGWLRQAGVRAACHDWSPARLTAAVTLADRCVFFGPGTSAQGRRIGTALRAGGAAPGLEVDAVITPSAVGALWRDVLLHVGVEAQSAPEPKGVVMLLLDLVQDLDLALPLIDEFRRRSEVQVRIVASSWLCRRSPRVTAELDKRGIDVEVVDRGLLASGDAPSLEGVSAVIAVAESDLPAHERAHVLIARARDACIPTFSFQHGVENVGLVHFEFETEHPAALASDHFHVWFSAEQTPQNVPAALRPRLVHTGRLAALPAPVGDLKGALAGFDAVVAVFENLHWARYAGPWKRQFLSDCVAFAGANPRTAVMLKPHHAGLWSVRNHHLLPDWPPNLILADPTDPFWEPFTSASLLQLADRVITTPSTVALDAAQASKPVAVAAYGLDLPAYSPLPLLQSLEDWLFFASQADSISDARRRARFVEKTVCGEDAAAGAASYVLAAARERARFRRRMSMGDEI